MSWVWMVCSPGASASINQSASNIFREHELFLPLCFRGWISRSNSCHQLISSRCVTKHCYGSFYSIRLHNLYSIVDNRKRMPPQKKKIYFQNAIQIFYFIFLLNFKHITVFYCANCHKFSLSVHLTVPRMPNTACMLFFIFRF